MGEKVHGKFYDIFSQGFINVEYVPDKKQLSIYIMRN